MPKEEHSQASAVDTEDGDSAVSKPQTSEVNEMDVKDRWRPKRDVPRVPIPIQALMQSDPDVDKFKVTNPPLFKPLPQKRIINQFYRHFNKSIKQLRAPLPQHIIDHLKYMAYQYKDSLGETEFHRLLKKEFNTRPVGRKRPWSRKLHILSARFVRRRYQRLLKEYIPKIDKKDDGTWEVENATGRFDDSIYPLLQPEHKMGFTFSCGTKAGEVNEDGSFADRTLPRSVFYGQNR